MRIIAGEHRGRRLLPPTDQDTRPVTDRVKQSLFDVVTPYLADATHAMDVFAGTGSFGLEAASRGVEHVTCFEKHKPALERLRKNIEAMGLRTRVTVRTKDIYSEDFAGLPTAGVIFLDPPYRQVRAGTYDLDQLVGRLVAMLDEEGVIVFRHDEADGDVVLKSGREVDRRTWGNMTARLLTRE